MTADYQDPVQYHLPLEDLRGRGVRVDLNECIDREVALLHMGEIHCIACARKTRKSYNQGYCYPCFQTLAACDLCILKPETCHYFQGTCRQPEWGEAQCMQDHYVYLANTSGLKVGITRGSQTPTRWIDQGAGQALPMFRVRNRLVSGLLEVALKSHVPDRTDWRKMLKGPAASLDLAGSRDELLAKGRDAIARLGETHGDDALHRLDGDILEIRYPVRRYPETIRAHNLDRQPEAKGRLLGIKGQYLLLDTGVLNIRKVAGYHVRFMI